MKQILVEETPLERAKLRLADALREVERTEKAVRDAEYYRKNALEVFRQYEAELKTLEESQGVTTEGD